jgi:hypothetical protein
LWAPRCALLWRGDLIHGGGFDNALTNGAMRLHLKIPMKESDVSSLLGSSSQVVSRTGDIFPKLSLDCEFSPGNGGGNIIN